MSRPSDVPPRLGRFVVSGELGRGGIGVVVAAQDPELDREVAVKVLQPGREGLVAGPEHEARTTARLEHPNIVPIYDIGREDDGRAWIVMKQVRGRSLAEVLDGLREGDRELSAKWTRFRLLSAFVQVCQGMAFAHDRDVVHRDLKPANVMVGAFGEVLVMDWGVAWSREDITGSPPAAQGPTVSDAAETVVGEVVGTLGYMAPEQARGELATSAADVWSLGALLYELLTLRPAIRGASAPSLMFRTVTGAVEGPTTVRPDVPAPLAALAMGAMAPDPADRPSAAGLGEAVTDWLEGARRRDEALRRVAVAEEAWLRFKALDAERDDVAVRLQGVEEAVPAWASLEEKGELLALRERLASLAPERARAFDDVVAAAEQALSHDAECAEARALLAEVYYSRFEEAEARGDIEQMQYLAGRTRAHDRTGRWTQAIEAPGRLLLDVDEGVDLTLAPVERRGLVWSVGEAEALEEELEPGSYLLTARSGDVEVRYPVFLRRGATWTGSVTLPAEVPEGFVFVPGGPFLRGGDPEAICEPSAVVDLPSYFIAREPVRGRDWARFLNAVQARDPAEALRRSPRSQTGPEPKGPPYWAPDDGRWEVPETDTNGEPWDPDWPIFGVSWEDAVAYAGWVAEESGLPLRLPTMDEWEKAARGVDGRAFPWGDTFDASLCKMRETREGRPQPEEVGSCAGDVSIYGVRDLAGSIRELCGDVTVRGSADLRPVRGGGWNTSERVSRAAHHFAIERWCAFTTVGFRLAMDA